MKGKMKKDKEISLWKTLFVSAWMYSLIAMFGMNAVLYARDKLLVSTSLRELCFWVTAMLAFAIGMVYMISKSTFYVYKKKKQEHKK